MAWNNLLLLLHSTHVTHETYRDQTVTIPGMDLCCGIDIGIEFLTF